METFPFFIQLKSQNFFPAVFQLFLSQVNEYDGNPVPGPKFSRATCSTVTLLRCNCWYICQVQLSDMAIFVGIMLTKSTSGEIKDFRSKSKKIISYISVMCFPMLGSHCMLHDNQIFFSIPYLPPSKLALLTLFFREI